MISMNDPMFEWRLSEDGKRVQYEERGLPIIVCDVRDSSYVGRQRVNGQLLAASPKLFQGCQLALGMLKISNPDSEVVEFLESALRKIQ